MPTIREVAKACGVSPMTVSYVLNNPGRVRQETRTRVLLAMREMGYRPPAAERGEEDARGTLTIGVVYSRWNRLEAEAPYYRRIVGGILEAADDLVCHVTLFSHHSWEGNAYKSLRVYCDGRCDGLIIFAPKIGSDLVAALRERGVPFVLVGDTGDLPEDWCVDVDNIAAARNVTEYLLGLGHRRIAYLPGAPNTRVTQQREDGWRAALEAADVAPTPAHLLPGDWSPESGRERAARLLSLPDGERPTALFCAFDGLALAALAAAREMGLRVPQDVSIIGFDDIPAAPATEPPLTTVLQPYAEIGERAVRLLLTQMGGGSSADAPGERKVLLPTKLIVRQSAGPPPPPGTA